jgi:hypothetical protein
MTASAKLGLVASAFLAPCFATTAQLTADQIVAKYLAAEEIRDKHLRGYSVNRRYVLQNESGSKKTIATARMEYAGDTGKKQFQILGEEGAGGFFRIAIHKVLQAETEASSQSGENETAVSPANYTFRLVGTEVREARTYYVLELKPKRKSKYLLDGKAWIDAEDFALARIEGRTAASVSFWVGKPYIEQSFKKVGDYWLLSSNRSVTDARFFGRTVLSIESSGYSVKGERVEARRPTGMLNAR